MFSITPLWQEVLDYWFEEGLTNAAGWPSSSAERKWFRATAGDDAEIEERFGQLVEAALYQELVEWERQPLSRVALVILLDQFTRQIYRGKAQAFQGDHRAATLAVEAVSRRMLDGLPLCAQTFLLMPLMHAEDEDLQNLCVEQLTQLHEATHAENKQKLAASLHSAHEHADIIRRFGRFPHRNAALGRTSTAEELAFLETSGRFGQ